MSGRSEFVEFVIERMAPIGKPRVRAMFGGYGVYLGDNIFAIIADDRLYFKVDGGTRGEFEGKGLQPFTYAARGKSVTMQYFEAPAEVFDEPDAMRFWGHKALGAAIRAKQTKGPKTPRRSPPG